MNIYLGIFLLTLHLCTSEDLDVEKWYEDNVYVNPPNCSCVINYQCTEHPAKNNGAILKTDRDTACPGQELCCAQENINRSAVNPRQPRAPPNIPTTDQKCGERNPYGSDPFRLGGARVNYSLVGEFPWMVAIFTENIQQLPGSTPKYCCGGSLIHPSVVLTTAHNIHGRHMKGKQLLLRAGKWNISEVHEDEQERQEIGEIVVHPEFQRSVYWNDAALVIVTKPFELTLHVSPVCLVPPNERVESMKGCTVSGWGKSRYGSSVPYETILKKIDLPLVFQEDCTNANRKKAPDFEWDPSYLCAGGKEGDACSGDGGSPLVCRIQNVKGFYYYQVGIVSWGFGCRANQTQYPGVYTSVAYLRNWIDQAMIARGFETSYYSFT